MLTEVKVKTARKVGDKIRKTTETYVLDTELLAYAEYAVMKELQKEQDIENSMVVSIKVSSLKEIADQYKGNHSYIATLKDLFHDDNGKEKAIRYKVLLWADDLTQATKNARAMQSEGYDMQVEGLQEADWIWLGTISNN